jgi:rhodanese-related sulfurtransferase
MMNKTLKEVIIILSMATILGLAYNFCSDNPLPLIQESKDGIFVSDSVLFGGLQKSTDTIKAADSISIIKDTTKKIKNDSNIVKKDTIKSIRSDDGILQISYNQVIKLLGRNDVVFIDARTPENYQKAHIGKAINIYPYESNEAHIGKIASLDREKTYVVYCDGGSCDLSHDIIKIMLNFGFPRVFLYLGGWEEWINNHQF